MFFLLFIVIFFFNEIVKCIKVIVVLFFKFDKIA